MSTPRFQSGSPRSGPVARRAPGLRCLLVMLLLLVGARPLPAFAVNAIEYQVKAGFLFNFAKFIEWPGSSLAPGASLRLGIVAPDEVYAVMEAALAGKMAGDHPLVVERLAPEDFAREANLPHIVFLHHNVSRTEGEVGLDAGRRLLLAEKQTVLLVGESADFALSGGMIGFVQRGENLRFQVNLTSAQRAGLKLSARLAGLAELVNPSKP